MEIEVWLILLSGPLLMLLLSLVFDMCILNAITNFISSQMEVTKFQLLVTEYSPLGQQEPHGIFKV
jgi:hypothetical protein